MRKELRRYSSIGNKEGIVFLCKKLLTGNMEDIFSIKTSSSFLKGIDLNFNCGLMTLEDLGLIKIEGSQCCSTTLTYASTDNFVSSLCSYCIRFLLDEHLIDVDEIKYSESLEAYILPTYSFKLECAVVRNLLITLEALSTNGAYCIISQEYEQLFVSSVKKARKKTQVELLEDLEKQRIIGEEGERFVLNYEYHRCAFTPSQIQAIKQISIVDVSAGYDIISWEDETATKHRYIEVKTYSGKFHFNWSSNEIESARLRGNEYFLYIVDHSAISNNQYVPVIIRNPYKSIIEDSSYKLTPTSYLVEKIAESNWNSHEEQIISIEYSQDEFEPSMAAEGFEYFKPNPSGQSIIDYFGGNSFILVGCYKTKKHLEWIKANNLYNIRLGNRKGSMENEQAVLDRVAFLVLYNIDKPNNLLVYKINEHKEITGKDLLEIGYPKHNPGKRYMIFQIALCSMDLSKIVEGQLVERLIGKMPNHINGAPIILMP